MEVARYVGEAERRGNAAKLRAGRLSGRSPPERETAFAVEPIAMIMASWSKPGRAINQSIASFSPVAPCGKATGHAVVGAEQQPPDVGAERPAVVGLDHHAAEVGEGDGFFLALRIGDADAVARSR